MSHLPIDTSRDAEPIRLFKSDFLEFFTHISPAAIIALWLPIVVLLLIYAVLTVSGPAFPEHPIGLYHRAVPVDFCRVHPTPIPVPS